MPSMEDARSDARGEMIDVTFFCFVLTTDSDKFSHRAEHAGRSGAEILTLTSHPFPFCLRTRPSI